MFERQRRKDVPIFTQMDMDAKDARIKALEDESRLDTVAIGQQSRREMAKDARIARLVALLREVEWAGVTDRDRDNNACPSCHLHPRAGHLHSCRLAQEIREGG